MVFSSLTFLFAFLPIALIGYYLFPKKIRIGWLLLVSLVFYAWGEPIYVLLMVASIVVNWLLGLGIARYERRKKLFLMISVALNLSLLAVFKYAGFFWDIVRGLFPAPICDQTLSIRLPIGISFFTFQILSYCIDVYRGNAPVQKNPILFGAYVTMFPQLIAGPIVRYVDIERQLTSPDCSLTGFSEGVRQFTVGLSKKVLLANAMGTLWTQLSNDIASSGAIGAWVGLLAYTFQIYFDFSGYSDMACGLGRMLGFRFAENFRYPYIAESISDFWRRWHISLSTWFREYVYIPLGGNRRGMARQALNLLIVWTLTGLWHGASWNFLVWGLYYGILLILEKFVWQRALDKAPRVLKHLYTMLLEMIGWGIFAFTDFRSLLTFGMALIGIGTTGALSKEAAAWAIGYLPWLLLAAFSALPLGKKWFDRFADRKWMPIVSLVGGAMLFALCVAALASESYNPFIYFRF